MVKRMGALLLALLLLSGCGSREQAEGEAPEGVLPEAESAPAGLTMMLEHERYDPTLESYTYIIKNELAYPVFFGEEYSLEKLEKGSWCALGTAPEDFTAIGYVLEPGESQGFPCSLGIARQEGRYRLQKEVEIQAASGQQLVRLYAEFEVGESPYSAESPYGYPPLEALPETYGTQQGKRDGLLTISERGISGEETLVPFLQKVTMNIPCQLRTVQEFNEGSLSVLDVVYEDEKFCLRARSGGVVTEQYFSGLVTDGSAVCLGNGVDWETAQQHLNGGLFYFLPQGAAAPKEAILLAEEWMQRQAESGTVCYRLWSPDGTVQAALTDRPGELLMQSGARGETFTLRTETGETQPITDLQWEDGLLIVYTEAGARAFDPVEWILH